MKKKGVPSQPTRGLGSLVSCPSGAPVENGFQCFRPASQNASRGDISNIGDRVCLPSLGRAPVRPF